MNFQIYQANTKVHIYGTRSWAIFFANDKLPDEARITSYDYGKMHWN